MPQNDYNQLITQFQQFRQKLYNLFPHRQDSLMDLLDALSSNVAARSPVELSLNPLFRRDYSALYKAIAEAFPTVGEDSDNSSLDNSLDFGQRKNIFA